MTLTSASASRAMRLGAIEDVRLLHLPYVAVLSLALVALLELVQASMLLIMDQPFGVPELMRDLILKTPWSIIVCIALWSGLRYGRGSAVVGALVAVVAAPVASLSAHALAVTATSYTLSAMHEMIISPYLVAAQKGVAYVSLALLVLWLWARTRATAWQHAAAGLAVGLLFGGALLLVEAEWGVRPLTTSLVVAWAVNEVLFPIGCALLLWHVRARALAAAIGQGAERSRTIALRGDGGSGRLASPTTTRSARRPHRPKTTHATRLGEGGQIQ
jgi:hypothetical protein